MYGGSAARGDEESLRGAGFVQDEQSGALRRPGAGSKNRDFLHFFLFVLHFSIKIDSQSILFAFTHWVLQIRTAKLS